MNSVPLGWPLNLSRPQIPLLRDGVRILALSASQKCCMAENEIKDMKTNVSPSSTQTRMGGAAAGGAEEPEAVGGWTWQKDSALYNNGGNRAWTWCLLSQRLEPEIVHLTYNYGEANERERETETERDSLRARPAASRGPWWWGGGMATTSLLQASLVWP